jgi:ArsR family transcriptional regulator
VKGAILVKKDGFEPTEEQLNRIGSFFKIMGDPTRLKICTLLLSGSRCVMHISEALGMSQSAVSHQLALLRGADLVKVSRNGKTQVYSIADEHVRLILDMALLHSCEE